jgi:hypothetical protein
MMITITIIMRTRITITLRLVERIRYHSIVQDASHAPGVGVPGVGVMGM